MKVWVLMRLSEDKRAQHPEWIIDDVTSNEFVADKWVEAENHDRYSFDVDFESENKGPFIVIADHSIDIRDIEYMNLSINKDKLIIHFKNASKLEIEYDKPYDCVKALEDLTRIINNYYNGVGNV